MVESRGLTLYTIASACNKNVQLICDDNLLSNPSLRKTGCQRSVIQLPKSSPLYSCVSGRGYSIARELLMLLLVHGVVKIANKQ